MTVLEITLVVALVAFYMTEYAIPLQAAPEP